MQGTDASYPYFYGSKNIRKIEGLADARQSFSICDQTTEMITDTKYLGVQIDSQLKWDKHIDTIKNKAHRSLGLNKYAKKYQMCSTKRIEKLLCPKSKISALQQIQNRAARIVTNSICNAFAFQ